MKMNYSIIFFALICAGCFDNADNPKQTTPSKTTQQPVTKPAAPQPAITSPQQQKITSTTNHQANKAIPAKITTNAQKKKEPPKQPDVTKAKQTGKLSKQGKLREKPFSDAKILATLSKGNLVEIILRKGGWYQVKTNNTTGWVRMMSVRKNPSNLPSSTNLADSLSLATGRLGTGNVAATSGIRGLDEENLNAAKSDYQALNQLEQYRVTAKQAKEIATDKGYKTRTISYITL